MKTMWEITIRRPSYFVSLLILILFAFLGCFGPMLYPHGVPTDPTLLYSPPIWKHLLGTDYAGADVLAQVVVGSRYVLTVAVLAAILTMFVGIVIGVIAGYIGGVVDAVLMRFTDFILTIPTYPLLIVLAVVIPVSGPMTLAALLSINSWGGLARAIRSQILSIKKRDFIEAARSLELGSWRIAFTAVLPLIMPYVIMHLILAVTSAIYGEVGLFFLGIVPIQATNWGVMLNFAFNASGAIYTPSSVFYLMAPIGAIVLLQLGAVTFTNALDEVFNPQLARQ